jgi:hypothetical protein
MCIFSNTFLLLCLFRALDDPALDDPALDDPGLWMTPLWMTLGCCTPGGGGVGWGGVGPAGRARSKKIEILFIYSYFDFVRLRETS